MKRLACFGMMAVGMTLWTGCGKSAAPAPTPAAGPSLPQRAQPRLPTLKLWLGAQELVAEVAATPAQIQTGMMFRTNLVATEGMVFVLPFAHRAGFWMMNCPTPLSCAYIDPQGVIQEIHDMEPFNTNTIVANSDNIFYVLETARGWFERNGVRPGMVVRTERGSLADTFRRRR